MKKQKKQNILTIIISIAIIALAIIVVSEIYSEKMNKEEGNKTIKQTTNNTENATNSTNTLTSEKQQEDTKVETPKNEYVGEEEQESNQQEDVTKTKEEKAIELAKKTWGENDTAVTFSIEQKDGSKYYIAVKSNATTKIWYEVDTDTWKIKEY